MLTINWIPYKLSGVNINDIHVENTIKDWIKQGYMEEVKENKEPMYDAWIWACINSKWDVVDYNPSILEKLSVELEERIKEIQECYDWELRRGYIWGLEDAINLLTSLETKEEPAEFSDAVKFEIERWCMPCTWNLPPEEAKKNSQRMDR